MGRAGIGHRGGRKQRGPQLPSQRGRNAGNVTRKHWGGFISLTSPPGRGLIPLPPSSHFYWPSPVGGQGGSLLSQPPMTRSRVESVGGDLKGQMEKRQLGAAASLCRVIREDPLKRRHWSRTRDCPVPTSHSPSKHYPDLFFSSILNLPPNHRFIPAPLQGEGTKMIFP